MNVIAYTCKWGTNEFSLDDKPSVCVPRIMMHLDYTCKCKDCEYSIKVNLNLKEKL